MVTALLVLVCGGAGAIARFVADAAIQSHRLGEFPLGTLAVNLTGTVVLGLLVGLSAPHRTMELIGTATIGSYTTFSTWMLETHRPAEAGEERAAWVNIAAGVVLGFAAILLGRALGRAL
jgi:fluoride exporter